MVAKLGKPKPVKVKKSKSRKKKSSRQLFEIELDRLVRSIVLLRDGCCVCPAPEKGHSNIRQPGHLIKRQKEGVRWDLYNVNEQCSSCNGRHNTWQNYYESWFVEKFGREERLRLEYDANNHIKYSIDELMDMRTQLTAIHELQLSDKSFKPRFTQQQVLTGEWRALHGIEIMTSYKVDFVVDAV